VITSEISETSRSEKTLGPAALVGALVTATCTIAFFLLFWNHFAGLRSGSGEYGGGVSFLQGLRPYRDYFTAATPLNILKSALVLSVFGHDAIVARAFAVFERLVMAELVFFWLLRMFRVEHAALAAIVTIVVSAGDQADPLASYNHDAILLAMISGFLAHFVLEPVRRSKWAIPLFATLSGVAAGLSFSTKQTIGLGVTAAVPVVVCGCLATLRGPRKAALFLAFFAVGWCVAAGILLVWLASLGILEQFLNMVFVKGPSAKAAHSSDFFWRFLQVLRLYAWAALAGFIALLLSWPALRKSGQVDGERKGSYPRALWLLLWVGLSLACGAVLSYSGHGWTTRSILKPVIYFSFFGVSALPLYYAFAWVTNRLSYRQAQFCLFASVSFACAFMVSLSFPAFEAMLVPGTGLLVAAMMDASVPWKKTMVAVGCCLLIFVETVGKLNLPFFFSDMGEPAVRFAHSRSVLPGLRGFVLPESTVRMTDGVVEIVRKAAGPKDKIFTYPELALLYILSGHGCPTSTCSHNIDVVNDTYAKSEAELLVKSRPAVLIYYRQPEENLQAEERIWRSGRRSGNRYIIDAVEALAKEYNLVATYPAPPYDLKVMVFVRPDLKSDRNLAGLDRGELAAVKRDTSLIPAIRPGN